MPERNTTRVEYTECFVAFIDVLGFETLVRKSMSDPVLLRRLTQVLNFAAGVPSGTKESRYWDAAGNEVEQRWQIQTRAFSDTVVIFMPKEAGSIGQVLFLVRYLHDRILELGLSIRGAVTLGGMYWDKSWNVNQGETFILNERNSHPVPPITLGPGLIEAYRLESDCAIYPRVLISDKLWQYLDQSRTPCTPFGPRDQPGRELADFVKTDADGLHYLDLLNREATRNKTERAVRLPNGGFSIQWDDDVNTQFEVTGRVRSLIAKSLDEQSCSEKIRAKYEWLRSYVNSIEVSESNIQ